MTAKLLNTAFVLLFIKRIEQINKIVSFVQIKTYLQETINLNGEAGGCIKNRPRSIYTLLHDVSGVGHFATLQKKKRNTLVEAIKTPSLEMTA